MCTLSAADLTRDLSAERVARPAPDISDLAKLWNAGAVGRRLALELAALSARAAKAGVE